MLVTIVCGPTASGKTNFAHRLAQRENGEVICIDSMQLYRALPILTASPEQGFRAEIPYHLYNILEPHESSCMTSYLRLAVDKITQCINNDKKPILVGGTGLYINALITGYSAIPEIDPEIRKMVRKEYDTIGHEAFIKKLYKIDANASMHLDKYRAIRAMEVVLSTNQSITTFHNNKVPPLPTMRYSIQYICPDKDSLMRNISMRFNKMLLLDVIQEVEDAIKSHPNFMHSNLAQAIGVKQIWHYLNAQCSWEGMTEQIQIKTWQYAKRQRTWFKKMIENLSVITNTQVIVN
ncbi:tRNA dimethylallyltransferase [Rickettsiales endosymbiont of Paramecium tredecaurelia]|uniref:tRNA (adenosine(37)-N6)-dimethylallyltransferase MiaA n=1 Tax=Candidatus Sarmatiella mevalonica TaxID=2770581 RepID=UPI001922F9C2|nr:tRNA (adenosine(37)-N6)-dimethylallyltransferase MiaA [Candidatus Sarmatiella mevalonica]MBL3284978.1 tRNA dimethylallyltransferase [Candidatus Sarmatiella mevalonica]